MPWGGPLELFARWRPSAKPSRWAALAEGVLAALGGGVFDGVSSSSDGVVPERSRENARLEAKRSSGTPSSDVCRVRFAFRWRREGRRMGRASRRRAWSSGCVVLSASSRPRGRGQSGGRPRRSRPGPSAAGQVLAAVDVCSWLNAAVPASCAARPDQDRNEPARPGTSRARQEIVRDAEPGVAHAGTSSVTAQHGCEGSWPC